MEKPNLKDIVKGTADLDCVMSGGIAVYILTSESNKCYQLEIDMTDKHDVGETASFRSHYPSALMLMRWIRRSIDNDTLIELPMKR